MDNYYGSPYNHWDYRLFKDVKPFHIKNKKRGFLASLGNVRYVQESNTLLLYKLIDYYKNLNDNLNRILDSYHNEATCTLEGFVQENGRNVVGLSVPVILITTQGLFLQRTVTNQEGFFIFRRVPLELSVLVIAVDTTYKYNAVVLANIKTLESNYDQSEV